MHELQTYCRHGHSLKSMTSRTVRSRTLSKRKRGNMATELHLLLKTIGSYLRCPYNFFFTTVFFGLLTVNDDF